MNKEHLKFIAIGVGALVALLAVGGYSYMQIKKASAHALELEEQLATSKDELVAFSKYVDYLPQAKQSLSASAEKLSTTVEEELTWVERGTKGVSPFRIDATAVLKLSVAYTFGFDLAADKFDLSVADKGIQVKVGSPQLLGEPVITVMATEYSPKSLLVEEDAATQEILQKVKAVLAEKGRELAKNEAARIIVEKKLIEHLRAFFAKQRDVKLVPDMVLVAGDKTAGGS